MREAVQTARKKNASAPRINLETLKELYYLCGDVTQRVGIGASPPPQPPRYSTLMGARKALHAHPGHQWLCCRLPKVMSRVPSSDIVKEFRFIGDLTACAMFELVGMADTKDRPDKRRTAIKSSVDHLIRLLLPGGAAPGLTVDTLNVLLASLELARYELKTAPRQQKSVKYPTLQHFARGFLKRHNIADGEVFVLEFAELGGHDCDAATAKRYLDK